MRRLRGRDEDYAVQLQSLHRLTREDQMPMMDRVESAAVDADAAHVRTFDDGSASDNQGAAFSRPPRFCDEQGRPGERPSLKQLGSARSPV